MYTDILGKTRLKLGLHIHTNESDGRLSPQEVAGVYKAAGFDAIAITDHWKVWPEGEIDGLRVLSGCEYNVGGNDTVEGVFHMVGIGMSSDPCIDRAASAQDVIDQVEKAGGITVLAHPAWSLNTTEQARALSGVAATEIYNTVSGLYANNRPYSGEFVDLCANAGVVYPLLATDDAHACRGEETVSYIMLDVSDGRTDTPSILEKIKAGAFFATQGPEVHISYDGEKVRVQCTPAARISFFSACSWHRERNAYGEGITCAEYTPRDFEGWIRAEVTDAQGRCAWSNIVDLHKITA